MEGMMGLFGPSMRTKAKEAAVQSIRPILATLQTVGPGIPAGFWNDPYILGYLSFVKAFFVNQATMGKASAADRGFATADAFTELSNMNGQMIASHAADLIYAKDAQFNRGGDDASVAIYYDARVLKDEHKHPQIVRASQHGKITDRTAISAHLMLDTLFAEVERIKKG
jgi:hypothetical protein